LQGGIQTLRTLPVLFILRKEFFMQRIAWVLTIGLFFVMLFSVQDDVFAEKFEPVKVNVSQVIDFKSLLLDVGGVLKGMLMQNFAIFISIFFIYLLVRFLPIYLENKYGAEVRAHEIAEKARNSVDLAEERARLKEQAAKDAADLKLKQTLEQVEKEQAIIEEERRAVEYGGHKFNANESYVKVGEDEYIHVSFGSSEFGQTSYSVYVSAADWKKSKDEVADEEAKAKERMDSEPLDASQFGIDLSAKWEDSSYHESQSSHMGGAGQIYDSGRHDPVVHSYPAPDGGNYVIYDTRDDSPLDFDDEEYKGQSVFDEERDEKIDEMANDMYDRDKARNRFGAMLEKDRYDADKKAAEKRREQEARWEAQKRRERDEDSGGY
jgi:hypothetical protein